MALSAIGKAHGSAAAPAVPPRGAGSVPPPALPPPDLSFSSDPAAAIAALLVKTGQEAKRIDRQLQATQERMQTAAEDREIAAMHAKADDVRAQGLVEGLASVASGALTVGAGATFGKAGEKYFTALSKAAEGGGQIAGGHYKGMVADDETLARQSDQIAARAKRAVDSAHDFQKDDADLIKTAIEFYKEYSGAQSQSRSAALHRS